MTVFVSGSSGLIGRAVVAQFMEEGLEVVPILRRGTTLSELRKILGLKNGRGGTIVHLAAEVPGGFRGQDSAYLAKRTRELDQSVAGVASEFQMNVLYASTCAIYPSTTSRRDYLERDAPMNLASRSPYVRAKADGEKLLSKCVATAVLRIAGAVGQGIPESTVLGTFLKQAQSGIPIQVWGSGTREQNYVDVKDIAAAFFSAYKADALGIFNVSSREPATMLKLARAVADAVPGSSYELGRRADPLDGHTARYSNEAAGRHLNWWPTVPLSESIESILAS